MITTKTTLTIGGSDPSGAGGIQADLKVFCAYRVYGMAVITALTSQNSRDIKEVMRVPAAVTSSQFTAIYEDIPINSLKIGMLSSSDNMKVISMLLDELGLKNIVLDPVFLSSSGIPLIDRQSIKIMVELLLPLVDIITPNLHEAGILAGMKIENPGNMKEAASVIRKLGPRYVLIKGGHLKERAIDILYDGTRYETFDSPKIAGKNFRGTGCALSAGIAAGLARGFDMKTSVEKAKDFVTRAIKNGYAELGKGMGILNHNNPVL